MTDWKMPEEWKEIFDEIHMYFELNFSVAMNAECRTISQEFMFHPRHIISFIEALLNARLLSTPTERDANEKCVADLKAALDGAKHENTAAWVKAEKLEAEVERLKAIRKKYEDWGVGPVLVVDKEAHDED